MTIKVVGIHIGKHCFHVYGADKHRQRVERTHRAVKLKGQ